MKCKLKNREELITKYHLNELSEDEMKSFEEHYFQCDICFKELRITDDAINMIKREGASLLTDDKSSERKLVYAGRKNTIGWSPSMRLGIAIASVSIIILILIFSLQIDKNISKQDNKIVLTETDSLETEDTLVAEQDEIRNDEKIDDKRKDYIAALEGPAFEPNAYFEEWITEKIRSNNVIIDTVFSPGAGDIIKNKNILFYWKLSEGEKFSLKIFNNKEEEIFTGFSAITAPLHFNILVESKTFKSSGIYYWRIEDETDVLYVGKFYFLKP